MSNAKVSKSLLIKLLTYLLTPETDIQPTDEGYEDIKWVNDSVGGLGTDLNPFCPKLSFVAKHPARDILCSLRECLVAQRWGESFRLVRELTQEHSSVIRTVFQVSLELCHQLDSGGRLLDRLINQLRLFVSLDKYELCLEYVFFLLAQEHPESFIQDAVDIITAFKTPMYYNKPANAALRQKQKEYDNPVLAAYKGLLLYAQWLVTKKNLDKLHDADDMNFIEEVEAAHEEKSLQILSDRALASLKDIEGVPGVWDIFITKYVQLVEHRGWKEEAERMLKKYTEENTDNPNAFRYLLEHYQRHGYEEEAYHTLQVLAKQLPSEPLVLDLYDLHKQKGAGVLDTLPLLFDLLDFGCWQNSLRPWQYLANDLTNILERDYHEDTSLAIQKCWRERCRWWPQYHFTPYTVKQASSRARKEIPKVQDVQTLSASFENMDSSEDDFPGLTQMGPSDDMISAGQKEMARGSSATDMGSSDHMKVLVCKAVVATLFNTGEEFVAEVKSLVEVDAPSLEMLRRAAEASGGLQIEDAT